MFYKVSGWLLTAERADSAKLTFPLMSAMTTALLTNLDFVGLMRSFLSYEMVARAPALRCAATSPMLWRKKMFRGELYESEEALVGLRPRLDGWSSRSSSAFLSEVHEIFCALPNAILAVIEAPPRLI
eukprot:14335061-Heterocapsa_arctica.AAC.1